MWPKTIWSINYGTSLPSPTTSGCVPLISREVLWRAEVEVLRIVKMEKLFPSVFTGCTVSDNVAVWQGFIGAPDKRQTNDRLDWELQVRGKQQIPERFSSISLYIPTATCYEHFSQMTHFRNSSKGCILDLEPLIDVTRWLFMISALCNSDSLYYIYLPWIALPFQLCDVCVWQRK